MKGLTSAEDDNGHGINVAGILGAKKNGIDTIGVAVGAELATVKVVINQSTLRLSILQKN